MGSDEDYYIRIAGVTPADPENAFIFSHLRLSVLSVVRFNNDAIREGTAQEGQAQGRGSGSARVRVRVEGDRRS